MVRATSQQQQLSEFLGEFNSPEFPEGSSTERRSDVSELIQLESLPVETLAEMANEAAAACEASGRKTVEHAATCGRALLAIRPQIPHGEWLSWLAENFSQSQSRASQYMSIANYYARNNLEAAETIQGALRMIADTPERQAKRQEREAKKQERQPEKTEASPKPPAPAPAAPVAPAKPERPEWLADPDELDRPEEDDLPPLPRTNTHHTSANRRTPDARETDRAGIVCPDDPRGLQDGRLYVWSEAANRLFPATPEQVWAAAMELRPDALMAGTGAQKASPPSTKKIVDDAGDTKRFVRPTVAEVATYAKEIDAAIDAEQFIDFYTSKDWMIGKNKMKDWRAAVRTWKRQQAAKPGTIENGKVRGANWEDDGTGWEDLRNG